MGMVLDHLVICAPSLDEGVRYADARGLSSVSGGRHTGHGTANRIVPLGDTYLELVAVVDAAEAAGSPFGSWVAEHSSGSISVDAVCLRSDDIDAVCDRLGLQSVAMSRLRPDGVELAWRLAGLEEALTSAVPFFIEWAVPDTELPGRAPVEHAVGAVSVEEVVLSGDVQRLQRWTNDTEGVRIRAGEPGVSSANLRARSELVSL